jgi:exonuclease III
MITKWVNVPMLNFEPVEQHISYLSLQFKIFNITIIPVRTTTVDKDDTVKSSFYDTLVRVYQTLPKHDAVIVMGDMNAKVGEESLTPCTGKYRLYEISNYNVEKLCDFATCREFVTVIAMFSLKNIHLQTCISRD